MATTNAVIVPTREELFQLGSDDCAFYSHTFFPTTFRQAIPEMHLDMWDVLEDQAHRRVVFMVFRGGAKTTILRTFTSKRIAYGISRTILFVSAAQDHSKRSLRWLRNQVEFNRPWASTYGLRPGTPWTDEMCEIIHDTLGIRIVVLSLGITGQIRGFNLDDYRPDLIVVDDPCNEENTATPEQRKKTEELFFGGLENSLAPISESPDAKICLLQTPLQMNDLAAMCFADKAWASRRYGCLDSQGASRWEERFPAAQLHIDKQAAIDRNQLNLWLREMECKVIDAENTDFRPEWLQYYDIEPESMVTFMGIDPVPPPSPSAIAKGMYKRDFECLFVAGKHKSGVYLLEYAMNRGHTPDWTTSQFFRLLDRWRPLHARVDTVNYQATLKWFLKKEMSKRSRYIPILPDDSKRKKRHVILQAYNGIASSRRLFARRGMVEFTEQFNSYPFVEHDDVLNAGALAVEACNTFGGNFDDYAHDSASDVFGVEEMPDWRGAP